MTAGAMWFCSLTVQQLVSLTPRCEWQLWSWSVRVSWIFPPASHSASRYNCTNTNRWNRLVYFQKCVFSIRPSLLYVTDTNAPELTCLNPGTLVKLTKPRRVLVSVFHSYGVIWDAFAWLWLMTCCLLPTCHWCPPSTCGWGQHDPLSLPASSLCPCRLLVPAWPPNRSPLCWTDAELLTGETLTPERQTKRGILDNVRECSLSLSLWYLENKKTD